MLNLLGNVKNNLVDDLGKENSYAPDKDGWKISAYDVRPVDGPVGEEMK